MQGKLHKAIYREPWAHGAMVAGFFSYFNYDDRRISASAFLGPMSNFGSEKKPGKQFFAFSPSFYAESHPYQK